MTSREGAIAFDFDRLNRRFGPWISLALGLLTVVVFRRGLSFAPVALAYLVAGWLIVVVLSRWVVEEPGPPVPDPVPVPDPAPDPAPGPAPRRGRLRSIGRKVVASMAVGLYQNALFYLVPIWFASATPTSSNITFPALLAGMAVFSCFDHPFNRFVLSHPVPRTAWSSLVLFAALVPAAASVLSLPLGWYVAGSAAAASLVAAVTAVPGSIVRRLRGLLLVLLAAATGTAALTLSAPFLPPVPIVCLDKGLGTGVQDRELVGKGETFGKGAGRVYAWFAVAAPAAYRQQVAFHWYRDGEHVGRALETEVVGGRKTGFRTWSFRGNPQAGSWRVDLETDSGQVIGRVHFVVE